MRKTILILALTAVTVMACATDAFAQRRGYNGGRRGGGNRGVGISFGVNGVSPYYYDRGYSRGYYNGSPYGTQYYYADPVVQIPATEVRQSFYSDPSFTQQSASINVLLRAPDAQVWFDNAATSQRGMDRSFHTPALEPNRNFTYLIKARWNENGRTVERERSVTVQAGQSITVDFRNETGERLPSPNGN